MPSANGRASNEEQDAAELKKAIATGAIKPDAHVSPGIADFLHLEHASNARNSAAHRMLLHCLDPYDCSEQGE